MPSASPTAVRAGGLRAASALVAATRDGEGGDEAAGDRRRCGCGSSEELLGRGTTGRFTGGYGSPGPRVEGSASPFPERAPGGPAPAPRVTHVTTRDWVRTWSPTPPARPRPAADRGDHRGQLRAHRRRARRPRGAGRVRHRAALDLRRARPRRRRLGPRADRRRASPRATGSGSGRPTARSGRSRSTPRPRSARSWSTSTRPTAPTSSPTRSTSRACGC